MGTSDMGTSNPTVSKTAVASQKVSRSGCLRVNGLRVLWAVTLIAAAAGPGHAEFVCNAKTKRVNVFLDPPSYWPEPGQEDALEARDRLLQKQKRAALAPNVWSPADSLKEPFDIVDTLASGARVMTHTLSEKKGWVWISFRHSQNDLVGQGYVHESRLSFVACDSNPETDLRWLQDRNEQLDRSNEIYFETGPDEPPLEGARGAKRFETSSLSGAVRSHRVRVDCVVPGTGHQRPSNLTAERLGLDPYISACTELLEANPNYLEARLTRGDIYHQYARTPAPGIDSKSPTWAADVQQRREAQQRAMCDWTRASYLLPGDGRPTLLGNRLTASGSSGYSVEGAPPEKCALPQWERPMRRD